MTATKLMRMKNTLLNRETNNLSNFATLSTKEFRRIPEERLESDYRTAFSVDVDRILHSLAYTRYIDKTQVFYLVKNDHITHRVLHVQLVSKVARTIGRFLGLNEDLIEAIALGHDIGHPPFGHEGEKLLSGLCRQNGIGDFHHNVQSIRFLDKIEKKGTGWNLCLQTLDGILCHDGEIHNQELAPKRDKTFGDFDLEILEKTQGKAIQLVPMTMEGCVVRMADTISYIGRDIEDAIRLGLIRRSELPEESVSVLGDTNGTIVYQLVTDIIANSHQCATISFSPVVSDALKKLKQFNYERIYLNPKIKTQSGIIKKLYYSMFETYLEDIEKGNRTSPIFKHYLENMSTSYTSSYNHAEIVRDFIAGMTDKYFLERCPEDVRPTFVTM